MIVMTMGKVLLWAGYLLAIIGYIVAGNIGYQQYQLAVLFTGIVLSFIGFFMTLGDPPKKTTEKQTDETLRAKNIEFFSREAALAFCLGIPAAAQLFKKTEEAKQYEHLIIAIFFIYFLIITYSNYKEIYKGTRHR